MTQTRMGAHADVASAASSVPAGGPASERSTAVQASNDWWQQHDQRVYACIKLWVEQWWELQRGALIDAVGQVFGEERSNRREAIAKIKERVIQLEATNSLEARFAELAHEVKRGSEIPQGELLEKIEKLQRHIDDPDRVADLDARFRELVERVGELEKTHGLEARFTELTHEVKRRSEIVPGELLAKIEKLQRQLDDPKRIADLDARFCELAERVGVLEKTTSLEARFTELAHEVKRMSEISPGELLEKIEAMERQLDDPKRIADLDARFRELAERVSEIEIANSLEARFIKLAEAKGGPETQQRELHARIEELHQQLDDVKRATGQPGLQGPPGPPGKLPLVLEYVGERVHYQSDVVTHAGALWQARRDTVHAPPHDDWVCLARAGRDGMTPTVRGTYDVHEVYQRLDIVALDGAAFIAKENTPGICPGSDWQMISRQGRQGKIGESITGPRGEKGEKGEKGEPGPSIHSWQLDPKRYRVSPLWSDGEVGPILELHRLFEHFMYDIGGLDERH